MSAFQRAEPSAPGSDLLVGLTLFVAGLGYGVWAAWLVPVRLWSGLEGLSLVVTFVGNLAMGLLAAWALRRARAALFPVLGWLVATAAMSMFVGPGGDIVVPGGLPLDPGVPVVGELNWLAGIVSAAASLLLGGLLARRAGFTRPWQPPKQGT